MNASAPIELMLAIAIANESTSRKDERDIIAAYYSLEPVLCVSYHALARRILPVSDVLVANVVWPSTANMWS